MPQPQVRSNQLYSSKHQPGWKCCKQSVQIQLLVKAATVGVGFHNHPLPWGVHARQGANGASVARDTLIMGADKWRSLLLDVFKGRMRPNPQQMEKPQEIAVEEEEGKQKRKSYRQRSEGRS